MRIKSLIKIIVFAILCLNTYIPLAYSMDAPGSADFTELQRVISEEKKNAGWFIENIINELEALTNGKMIELSFFPLKASYWWDKEVSEYNYKKFNNKKPLIIDQHFNSSVYDREKPSLRMGILPNYLHKKGILIDYLVNSLASAREKEQLFVKEDDRDGQKETPDILKGVLDYGIHINKNLDTFPSIFHLTKVLEILKDKVNFKEPRDFSPSAMAFAHEKPSEVILKKVNEILRSQYYERFSQQKHVLNTIIQDHLQKIAYKARQFHFEVKSESSTYNTQSLYDKIFDKIGYIIRLMSVFDIDMEAGKCEIPGADSEMSFNVKNAYYLYYQFYEVINDLLFLLMYLNDGYTMEDFDKILTQSYVDRFPGAFAELRKQKDILIATYPMRSGMDAFANASLAIGYPPQDIAIAPKVAHLENTVYYEISKLLNKIQTSQNNKRNLFILTKNPTTEERIIIEDAVIKTYIELFNKNNLRAGENSLADYEERFIEQVIEELSGDTSYWSSFKIKLEDRAEADEFLFNKYKDKIREKSKFNFHQINENFYLEIPLAMNHVNPLVVNALPMLVENSMVIDENHAVLSGMTTDTINVADDPLFVGKLYSKFSKLIEVKQSWNRSAQPFIILWDVTMEVDEGPCYELINKFQNQILSGQVVFILFKSLQKYANLGVGKTKAGATTLIGKNVPFVQNLHTKLTAYGKDVYSQRQEYALMTFFYDRRYNEPGKNNFLDCEKLYYKETEGQAKKLQEQLNNRYPGRKYMRSGGCLFSIKNWHEHLPYADTFGFAIPTTISIENGLQRYSVGLNPQGLR